MSHFFFDIDDGVKSSSFDEVVVELADPEAARRAAITTLIDMAREVLPDGDWHPFKARIRDESGRLIYETTLTLDGRWIA